jgi:hypothetical protein
MLIGASQIIRGSPGIGAVVGPDINSSVGDLCDNGVAIAVVDGAIEGSCNFVCYDNPVANGKNCPCCGYGSSCGGILVRSSLCKPLILTGQNKTMSVVDELLRNRQLVSAVITMNYYRLPDCL